MMASPAEAPVSASWRVFIFIEDCIKNSRRAMHCDAAGCYPAAAAAAATVLAGGPVCEGLLPLHLSEQYFTSSHTFSHFFRHVKGLPHVRHILLGKSALFGAFVFALPFFARAMSIKALSSWMEWLYENSLLGVDCIATPLALESAAAVFGV